MTEIYILGALLIIVVSWLTYYSKAHNLVKLVVFPLMVVLCIKSFWHYQEELGKPINIGLPEEAKYVWHRVTSDSHIIVWLFSEDKEDRLYIIPYSREAAKQLEEQREMAGGGESQGVRTEKDGEGSYKFTTDPNAMPQHNLTK